MLTQTSAQKRQLTYQLIATPAHKSIKSSYKLAPNNQHAPTTQIEKLDHTPTQFNIGIVVCPIST